MKTIPRAHYECAIDDIINAVHEAQLKHGRTFEQGNDDRKLRILVEEVGEIAEAIQRLESSTADVYVDHLNAEIAQVAACCLRWLAGEP